MRIRLAKRFVIRLQWVDMLIDLCPSPHPGRRSREGGLWDGLCRHHRFGSRIFTRLVLTFTPSAPTASAATTVRSYAFGLFPRRALRAHLRIARGPGLARRPRFAGLARLAGQRLDLFTSKCGFAGSGLPLQLAALTGTAITTAIGPASLVAGGSLRVTFSRPPTAGAIALTTRVARLRVTVGARPTGVLMLAATLATIAFARRSGHGVVAPFGSRTVAIAAAAWTGA